jgi:hypothetical protein
MKDGRRLLVDRVDKVDKGLKYFRKCEAGSRR